MFTFKRIEGTPYLMDNEGDFIEINTNNKFNNKFFDGDVVDVKELEGSTSSNRLIDFESNFKLIENSKFRKEFIIGRFSTNSRVINGIIMKNKKRFTVYMVSPLDKNLPKFKVPFGGKLTGELIIKFKYSNWNEDIPFGEITSDGEVFECNDLNFERTILHHYNLYQKNKDIVLLNEEFKRRIECNEFNPLENNIKRRKFGVDFKRFIFSVDPENCEDIDDTFSYFEDDKIIELGVHIAQPIYWLSKEDLDKLSLVKFSSLYSSKRLDLFGEELTLSSSLKKGIERPAYSIIFKYNKAKLYKDFNIELFPSLVNVDENFSYDSPQLKSIEQCLKLKELTDKLNGMNNDYHKIVEFWMIKTNSIIGNKLSDEFKMTIPYRINTFSEAECVDSTECVDSSECVDSVECVEHCQSIDTPKNICDAFSFRSMNKAIYKYPDSKEDNCFHHSLQISKYCHFTSPIRRIIDTYIHICITYGIEINYLDLDLINKIESNTKKFHNELEYRDKLNRFSMAESSAMHCAKQSIDSTNIRLQSNLFTLWVYNIINKNFIEVYIEELGVFKKINIYHPKLSYRATCHQLNDGNSILFNWLEETYDYETDTNILKIEEKKFKIGDKIENFQINFINDPLPSKRILPFYLIKILKIDE